MPALKHSRQSSRRSNGAGGPNGKELPCMGECFVRRQNRKLYRGRAKICLNVYYDEELFSLDDLSYSPGSYGTRCFCLKTFDEGKRRIIPAETRLSELKRELEHFTGIPSQIQRLSHLDRTELADDEKTLRQLRVVRNNSCLTLSVHDVWLPFIVPIMRFGVALIYPCKTLYPDKSKPLDDVAPVGYVPQPGLNASTGVDAMETAAVAPAAPPLTGKSRSRLLRPPPGKHGMPQNEYKLSDIKYTSPRSPFFDVFFVDSQSKVAFWLERQANTPLFFKNDPAFVSKRAAEVNMRPMLVAVCIEPISGCRHRLTKVFPENCLPVAVPNERILPVPQNVVSTPAQHCCCATLDAVIRYVESEHATDAKVGESGGRRLLRHLLHSLKPAFGVMNILRQAVFLTNFHRKPNANPVQVARKVEETAAAKNEQQQAVGKLAIGSDAVGGVERPSGSNEEGFRGTGSFRDSTVEEEDNASRSFSHDASVKTNLGTVSSKMIPLPKRRPADETAGMKKENLDSRLDAASVKKTYNESRAKVTGRPKAAKQTPSSFTVRKSRPDSLMATNLTGGFTTTKAVNKSNQLYAPRERYKEFGNVDINSFLMDLDFFRGEQGQIYRPVYLSGRGPARRPPPLRRKPASADAVTKLLGGVGRKSKMLATSLARSSGGGRLSSVSATDTVTQTIVNGDITLNFKQV